MKLYFSLFAIHLAILVPHVDGQTPEILGEGTISTDRIEYGPALSADGLTLYFTRRDDFSDAPRILVSRRDDNGWKQPEEVPFTHPAGDELPSISRDGKTIYFSSARPAPGRPQNGRNDMWMVRLIDGQWSEPEHIGGALSTDDIDSHPVQTDDGLFFHSRRTDGNGSVNAYFAVGEPGNWGQPVLLPFNSPETDGEVAPLPDGSGAVFYSEREGSLGRGDLYFVDNGPEGWGNPVNLGPTINSEAWEWSPVLAHDGTRLLYARLSADGSDSDLFEVEFVRPDGK